MGPNYNLIDKWTSDSAIWFRVLQLLVYSSADSRTRRLIDGDSDNHCIIKDNQCNFEQFDFVSDVWVRSCPASSVSLSHALDSIEFGQFCHSRRGFGYPPLLSICFVCNLDFKQGFLNKCSLSIHLLLLPPPNKNFKRRFPCCTLVWDRVPMNVVCHRCDDGDD